MQKLAAERGGSCVSTQYVNNRTKLDGVILRSHPNTLVALIINIDISIFVEYVDARFGLAPRSVNTGLMSPNRARH